jgi:hypothetical protein
MSNYILPLDQPNLPKLSLEQGQTVIDYFFSNFDQALYTISRPDSTTYTSRTFESDQDCVVDGFYWMPARDLIRSLFRNQGVSQMFLDLGGIQAITSIDNLPPHTDDVRHINLIYNLCGLAETVFYQDLDKTHKVNGKLYDLDQIRPVEKHTLELHRWYFLNTAAIHSVNNLNQQSRVSITISVLDPFDDFQTACDRLKNLLFQ